MKNLRILMNGVLIISFLVICNRIKAQNFEKGMARVENRFGYQLYILSEPMVPYDEVFTVNVVTFSINTNSDQIDGKKGRKIKRIVPISDKILEFVRLVKEKDGTDNQVDAIIYDGGQIAKAIKFREVSNSKYRGIGRVKNSLGVDIYIFSTPANYFKAKKKWITQEEQKGLFNFKGAAESFFSESTTIEYDFNQIFHKLTSSKNRNKWPEGIIYDSTGKVLGFKYAY